MTAIEANARFLLLAILAEIELFAEVPDDAFEAADPFVVAMSREGGAVRPGLVGRPVAAAGPPDGVLPRRSPAGRTRAGSADH